MPLTFFPFLETTQVLLNQHIKFFQLEAFVLDDLLDLPLVGFQGRLGQRIVREKGRLNIFLGPVNLQAKVTQLGRVQGNLDFFFLIPDQPEDSFANLLVDRLRLGPSRSIGFFSLSHLFGEPEGGGRRLGRSPIGTQGSLIFFS